MPERRGVFISHVTDEAPIADALKVYLQRCFGHGFPVFVSSDYESIATGEEWFRAIETGLREAQVVIILLSRNSVDRRWINFESGLARGAGVRLLPLTISPFSPGDVGLPLSTLHVRTLDDVLAVEGVVQAIAEEAGLEPPVLPDAPAFIERLERIQDTLPMKSICLEPVRQGTGNWTTLRFRLSNTGNRDVELIEIEVRVPRLITNPNWSPPEIPAILNNELRSHRGVDYLFLWEKPFEGAMDIRFGRHRTLPRIVSPQWTPRFSDVLRIPVQTGGDHAELPIEYKVIACGVYVEPASKLARDIPLEP